MPGTAVEFDAVSIIFGGNPKLALPGLDQGLSREQIQQQCGQILGAHDCSLQVATGEILVLMGLSGSGKSTLLRAVNGLNPVTRGAVRVDDGERMLVVNQASAAELRQLRLRRVSMVFQQFALLPWRSVHANVGLGLELAGVDKSKRDSLVERQLELVGLSQWGTSQVSELSGGMQQRVGLARAFVTEAPILLMDEPFSALDPLIRAHLQDELLKLQQHLQRTIVFVSHDLDEAFKLGNRIAIMEGGRIVQSGTPREIFFNPVNQYVRDFVAHINPLKVLCASDVMQALVESTPTSSVAADASAQEALELLNGGQPSVGVRSSDGELLGTVTAASLVSKLNVGNNNPACP